MSTKTASVDIAKSQKRKVMKILQYRNATILSSSEQV